MRILFFIFLSATLLLSANDHNTSGVKPDTFVCSKAKTKNQIPMLTRRGCCSHHGGVCGCGPGGRQQCCDGTLSPTCTCFRNQIKGRSI
jgi:hypothetical protein